MKENLTELHIIVRTTGLIYTSNLSKMVLWTGDDFELVITWNTWLEMV